MSTPKTKLDARSAELRTHAGAMRARVADERAGIDQAALSGGVAARA